MLIYLHFMFQMHIYYVPTGKLCWSVVKKECPFKKSPVLNSFIHNIDVSKHSLHKYHPRRRLLFTKACNFVKIQRVKRKVFYILVRGNEHKQNK